MDMQNKRLGKYINIEIYIYREFLSGVNSQTRAELKNKYNRVER